MSKENGEEEEAPRVCSANELPTVKELRYQIALFKPLALVFGGLKGIKEFKAIEDELDGLVSVVDSFYSLLGERGWVFSEALNVERIRLIVERSPDPSGAEGDLVSYFQEGEVIETALGRLNRYEDMRPRLPLLRQAAEDYRAGRYYSVVLVLIAVMDGFVNDSDKANRRGLHARGFKEMYTGDCVATMWAGLPAVQSTFTKSFYKREDAEVYSVFRHGIMHGMVTNFNNVIVASKAWCMLFAVCDWVDSVGKDKKQVEEQGSQEKESLWAILRRHSKSKRKLAEDEERLAQWMPRFVELASPADEDRELVDACVGYLDCWQRGNYGKLAGYLLNPANKPESFMAGEARAAYAPHAIDRYSISSIRRNAPAAAEVCVLLESEKGRWSPSIRLVRYGEGGAPCCDWEPGKWKVVRWSVDPFEGA